MSVMKYGLSAAAGCLALGLAALSAQAAPVGSATADLKAAAGQSSSVEKADYRRCWWRNGRRYCRWVREYYPDDGYYPYYYGPSVGFYFGGGGGRHHRHHRR